LADLGFGKRSLQRRFHAADLVDPNISAIFLTHGHFDHVHGASAFAWEHKIPVFATEGTLEELSDSESFERVELLRAGCPVTLGDLSVTPFAISHDAAEPVGFRFEAEGVRGALATDLGQMTPEVCAHLGGCDWLILESNHDENLVRLGPYPWLLKQRLLSPVGHLSNHAVARFLGSDFDAQARHIFLAHLSRNNNTPALALDSAQAALDARLGSPSCCLHLTDQIKPSIVLNL
jgi:phosphoribosyl 1,2-cyclic phosphodiesterase